MAFESTNAILGIKSLEQQKKRDRWQKLMDLANAGVGIWETVSGRKYGTGERVAGEAFASAEAQKGRDFTAGESQKDRDQRIKEMYLSQDFEKELQRIQAEAADARAKGDNALAMERDKQAAKLQADRDKVLHGYESENREDTQAHEIEMAGLQGLQDQLDRESRERIANLDRLGSLEDKASAKQRFLTEWTQRAYELAVSHPAFLDANGVFDPVKRESLRKFLYSQVDRLPAEYLSQEEINWAKSSFDGFVDAMNAPSSTTTVTPGQGGVPQASRAELLSAAKEAVTKLADLVLPPEIEREVDKAEFMLSRPPSAGGGVLDVRSLLSRLTTIYNTYRKPEGNGLPEWQQKATAR